MMAQVPTRFRTWCGSYHVARRSANQLEDAPPVYRPPAGQLAVSEPTHELRGLRCQRGEESLYAFVLAVNWPVVLNAHQTRALREQDRMKGGLALCVLVACVAPIAAQGASDVQGLRHDRRSLQYLRQSCPRAVVAGRRRVPDGQCA